MGAVTQKQARPMYVIDSVAQFFDRNLKPGYDAEAALSAGTAEDFSKKIRIRKGKPTDEEIVLNPPSIGIEQMPASQLNQFFEVGSNIRWRFYNYALYCYPALRSDGYPSDTAAELLKAWMIDVCSTYSFRVLDYSNPLCTQASPIYLPQNMSLAEPATQPQDRGLKSNNAAEQNRFDMHLRLRLPVLETLVN